ARVHVPQVSVLDAFVFPDHRLLEPPCRGSALHIRRSPVRFLAAAGVRALAQSIRSVGSFCLWIASRLSLTRTPYPAGRRAGPVVLLSPCQRYAGSERIV